MEIWKRLDPRPAVIRLAVESFVLAAGVLSLGLALAMLWNWYAVPHGASPLRMASACVWALILHLLCKIALADRPRKVRPLKLRLAYAISPGVTLGIVGWALRAL